MSSIPSDTPLAAAARPGLPYPRAGFYFLLLIAVAVAAFWPSYFSRLGEVDRIRHFHGIVATTWMLSLAVQALLMRYRRLGLHRRLGRVAVFVVAPLFVASGLLVVQDMAKGGNPFQAAFGGRLAFVDLVATLAFVACVVMALRDRRNVQRHARWMACTALLLLPPALGRLAPLLPFVDSFDRAFHAAFVLTELVLLALLLDDRRSGLNVPPYRVLLGATVVQHLGFAFIDRLPAWQAIVHALGGTAA